MGAADYIAKPFNATVVLARVAMHLQMVRQRRMLEPGPRRRPDRTGQPPPLRRNV
jgi:DNA-binding response OmpR family regulator